MFEPGDLVECISSEPRSLEHLLLFGHVPFREGEVYVVQDIVTYAGDGELGVLICHFPPLPEATSWWPGRFRLLKRRDPKLLRRLMHEPAPMRTPEEVA